MKRKAKPKARKKSPGKCVRCKGRKPGNKSKASKVRKLVRLAKRR